MIVWHTNARINYSTRVIDPGGDLLSHAGPVRWGEAGQVSQSCPTQTGRLRISDLQAEGGWRRLAPLITPSESVAPTMHRSQHEEDNRRDFFTSADRHTTCTPAEPAPHLPGSRERVPQHAMV